MNSEGEGEGEGEDIGSDLRNCGSGGRMVEKELDAARALADLSATKRVVDESLPSDNQLLVDRRVDEDDVDVDEEISKAQFGVNCYRTKQNLTEAEKDAKKLLRVLANRESARQTIRRRQAIREELIRKAADLSLENKNMKMEKEMIMKEYDSLKDRNKQLKDQMANTMKRDCNTSSETAAAAELSTNYPVAVYGRPPFSPYVWPFCFPPCAWFYPLAQDESCSREQNITPELEKKASLPNIMEGEEEGEVVGCSLTLAIEEAEEESNVPDKAVAMSSADVQIESKTNQHENFLKSASKLSNATAAADARKKRKELKKLKLLHGRNAGLRL